MNKKASHVGFMLSFVIFLTFIVFFFVVFNPIVNFDGNKEPSLEHLERNLLEMFDSNLTKINNVANEYSNGYDQLKSDLNVPDNVEFAFVFSDDGIGDIVAEKDIPESVNIYTKEVFVLYYDGYGEDYGGYLTIKVW